MDKNCFIMIKKYISILYKIILWIAVTIIFSITGSYFFPFIVAIIGAASTASVFVAISAVNESWLFPKFYMTNRRKFVYLNLIVSIIFTAIHLFLDIYLTPEKHLEKMKEMPIIFPILRSFSVVTLGNFISITLLLANALKSNAEREKQLKEDKLGTEIKLLKAQINPHFIFNALNNIYSLTYTKTDTAPESVLKLSEMLRYVFYDCSNDHVKLGAEIEYISNFIAFQQMKSEHEQTIHFNYKKVKTDIDIAPMLFIPFIENAFKYSKVEEYIDAYVRINLNSDDSYLNLEIKNSIPYQGKSLAGNGLGINNVRKRLDLLYPDKYSLEIIDRDTSFLVNLKIEIK